MANGFFENIATMLQFPWRFLGPASACILFVGAVGLERSEILRPCRNVVFALLVGLNLLIVITVPTDNNHMPYKNVKAVASKGHETKLGTSVGLFYPHEWRLRDAEDSKLTTSVVISDIASVAVRDYQKKGTKAAVSYVSDSDTAYLELPIQNYLGYRAKDENGESVKIEKGEGGRMRFFLKGDGGEHRIYVRYGPVAGFVAADIVSALTILLLVLWRFWPAIWHGELGRMIRLHRELETEEMENSDEA